MTRWTVKIVWFGTKWGAFLINFRIRKTAKMMEKLMKMATRMKVEVSQNHTFIGVFTDVVDVGVDWEGHQEAKYDVDYGEPNLLSPLFAFNLPDPLLMRVDLICE